MPKCQYRKRSSDELLCGMLVDPGQEMCPRHLMLQKAEMDSMHAKEVRRRLEGKDKKSTGPMPNTREELLRRGYQFTGTGECRGCGLSIEWWQTPNLRPAPFNPMAEMNSSAVSHFVTCKQAQQFQRRA